MTAIVAISHEGKVWMGADSAGSAGHSLSYRRDAKVFINEEFIIGFTSSFRMGQLLQYDFSPPIPSRGVSGMRFMVSGFIPCVKNCLSSGGYLKTENGEDSGGCFLVGYRGDIYCIQSDFQVALSHFPYAAIGCGEDIALGSLYSTQGLVENVTDRITTALAAAESFSTSVTAPFVIESL